MHRAWLLDVAGLPTASGREQNVIAWVRAWALGRPDVRVETDGYGNLSLSLAHVPAQDAPPVYFTAHMDHPAFVVQRALGGTQAELVFRGGVMDDYFDDAEVRWHGPHAGVGGRLRECVGAGKGGKAYLAEFDHPIEPRAGDVVTWDLPGSQISDELPGGVLHASACDDLAALAAAVGALEELRLRRAAGEKVGDVRLLFTRAEEIGFVGAIGACRAGTMPTGSRVIALENSRASSEAPIGGGPIVRVGDRLSIFTPGLTDAVNKRAEHVAGGSQPTSAQKAGSAPRWKWQRRLMSGGACEASVFCAYGYEATCVCLPLGNYHNMADLDAVQAGTNASPARCAREFISVSDFEGMVDLLVACGEGLPSAGGFMDRLDTLWKQHEGVLGE